MADSSWAIQMKTAGMLPDGRYNVSVRIRCDAPELKGASCGIGIYDAKIKREVKYVSIPCEKIRRKEYIESDLGEFSLNNDRYFFVRKISENAPGAKIFVDCLSFSKAK